MNSLWNGSCALAAGIGAALILGAPSIAEARTEVLRWTHPDSGSVASFNVHFGTASGSYGTSVPAGKPVPDSQGIHSFSFEVPVSMENELLYITVTALGEEGQEGSYSNERTREPPVEEPPVEEPPAVEPLGQPGRPVLMY
jgi:hypothetical protein